jgi:hypothetical protein
MDISTLLLQIVLVMLPGICGAILVERLTIHRPWDRFRFSLYALVLGFAAYFFTSIVLAAWNRGVATLGFSLPTLDSRFWSFFSTQPSEISSSEIAIALATSVPLAYLVSAFSHQRWLGHLGILLRATNKYGDDPLFYAELARLKKGTIVKISPDKAGFIYEGTLRALSKEDEIHEITISDVVVYRASDQRPLYRLKMCYVSCDTRSTVVEVYPDSPEMMRI